MRSPALVALFTLLTSCRGATAPPDTSLSVTVASDVQVVSAQQPTTLSITVVNVSDAPASLHTACGPHFDVLDAGGVRVGPPQRFCSPTIYTPMPLGPDASYTIEDAWSGNGAASNSQVGTPLPAGTYTIVARVRARVAQRERVYLSAPITVQVGTP